MEEFVFVNQKNPTSGIEIRIKARNYNHAMNRLISLTRDIDYYRLIEETGDISGITKQLTRLEGLSEERERREVARKILHEEISRKMIEVISRIVKMEEYIIDAMERYKIGN